jgi:hypothetical protein
MMRNRTLALIGTAAVAVALALGGLGVAMAQTAPAGCGYGPTGMMGSYGPGGMMGSYGRGGMMGGPCPGTGGTNASLGSLPEAQASFQRYLDQSGNPDLVLDEVMEFDQNFYAIVKERSTDSGAFELLASKQTGVVFPEYGPNMMWNTKYGHMVGHGQGMMTGYGNAPPTSEATVTPARAQQIAQQWLDVNQPGSMSESPDAFPGYYTAHFMRDGTIAGMLSVNATTGQVWYHNWHGAFVGAAEVGQ